MEIRPLEIRRPHRPGDACECAACRGRLRVYTTRIVSETQRVQYLECNLCAWKPDDNKRIVPLEFAPPRQHLSDEIDEIS